MGTCGQFTQQAKTNYIGYYEQAGFPFKIKVDSQLFIEPLSCERQYPKF